MGQVYKPNLAISTEIIVKILDQIRRDVRSATLTTEKFDLILFGSYLTLSYVISLRGSEGLMLDLTTMRRELDRSQEFCWIALRGKVKGESNERDHLFPCCNLTKSGIDVRLWIKSLVLAHKCLNREGGPAITTSRGVLLSMSALDLSLHRYLSLLHQAGVEFPPEIKGEDDIYDRFSMYRSVRRASNTRALNQGISPNDIDVVNRWKSVEAAQGTKPGRQMRQHYAESALLKEPFLRYTRSM